MQILQPVVSTISLEASEEAQGSDRQPDNPLLPRAKMVRQKHEDCLFRFWVCLGPTFPTPSQNRYVAL
jgi:hypothetical protein